MQIVKLSESVLKKLPIGSDRVRDHQLPIVAVPAKGKARISLFVVKRFAGASASWIKIGVWPEITWTFAHERALAVLSLHAAGKSPVITKDLANHRIETVCDVLAYALQRIEADNKMSPARLRNVAGIIRGHLMPAFSHVAIAQLDLDCVYQKLIAPRYDKYKTSYLSLILRTLKQCFGIAAHRVSHTLPDWQFSQYSKVRVLPKIAAFNPSQISNVIAKIKAEPRQWLRVMAAWCLLYAVRVSECCVLTWRQHVDTAQRIYRIPADVTKNKKAHQLPLTDVALDVLAAYRRCERERGRRSDRLFPARRNAWRAINSTYASNLLSAMLQPGSSHDLRKLARAWLMENDVDNYVGRLILNQRQHVLDDTYVQQLLKDKSRAALDMWHARLVDAGLLDALAL